MHPCRSRGCKNIKGQSWRLIKNLPVQPALRASGSRLAELAIFFATSNFDLKYFCNLLTYKNVQYLIWKIWFISVWSLKPKAVVWLLTGFMLGQSTLISYHTEANGCIFFAAGVNHPPLATFRRSWPLEPPKLQGHTKGFPLYTQRSFASKFSIQIWQRS